MICSEMCEPANLLLERQLVLLERLAEAGLQVALDIQAQCAEAGAADSAMAFARVARAVRQTVLLQSRLQQDGSDRRATTVRAETTARKARVERIVSRVIDDEIQDTDEAIDVLLDARERLEGDDIYGDVMTLALPDLIARICKDLGLQPDWEVLSQEAWAKEEKEECPLRPFGPPPPQAGEDTLMSDPPPTLKSTYRGSNVTAHSDARARSATHDST
jgi:hypothetical protein